MELSGVNDTLSVDFLDDIYCANAHLALSDNIIRLIGKLPPLTNPGPLGSLCNMLHDPESLKCGLYKGSPQGSLLRASISTY